MDRNDRNTSENTRQRQGQQSFHRNPQRPPAPDYRSRQRENASYERDGEYPARQEGSARMNPRQGQNPRSAERKYDLPDRPQQRRNPREAILTDERGDQGRFSRDPGRTDRQDGGRQNPGREGSAGRQGSAERQRQDWQREPGHYSRRDDGQRAPRRFDRRDAAAGSPQELQDGQRDRRRPDARGSYQEGQRGSRDSRRQDPRNSSRQNDRSERMNPSSRSPHDDEFYNAPRAADPRRRDDRGSRYDGMGEGSVDLGSFDINYKGDGDGGRGFKAPAIPSSLTGKPMLLAVFAVAAVLITVLIFAVVSRGEKSPASAGSGKATKYEYKIPDTVTVGGTVIQTDSDCVELAELNISDISDLSYCYLVSSLFINGNSISDLTPIGDCISLKTIDAHANQIGDVMALSHLNQLEDVDVSGNQISDLSPLSKLKKLERLNVGHNKVSDLTPLADCSALRQLIVSDNSVSDLLPIAGLSSLTTLEAANNRLSDVSALGTLSNLSTLNLSGNSITDVKPLKSLSSVTILDLSDNPISDVSLPQRSEGAGGSQSLRHQGVQGEP